MIQMIKEHEEGLARDPGVRTGSRKKQKIRQGGRGKNRFFSRMEASAGGNTRN